MVGQKEMGHVVGQTEMGREREGGAGSTMGLRGVSGDG
jgi:hypothetical protein